MKTVLTNDPVEAAEFIKRGGVVAFPTETVYGLGANLFNENAIANIFKLKKRPANNPLITHVSSVDQIGELVADIPLRAEKFIEAFFPGPLTIVLYRSGKVPSIATAGLDTIGIRMPRLKLANEFLSACQVPVVAPSANISGRPSPTKWQAVSEDMFDKVDCILQGDQTEIGLESTVVDCTGDVPLLLRQGAISIDELRRVVGNTQVYKHVKGDVARSPGLLHRHYAPRASVHIVRNASQVTGAEDAAFIGLKSFGLPFKRERILSSADGYAQAVFEFFRDCDRRTIKTIYCEPVPETGIGAALMDRLRRASER
ncbi:MAG: L-threonylcarbamoyladenylate synthase [Pyrinomonadaceae bacterium]